MTERETDPINQARVRMLFYILVAYAIFGLTLIFAYSYNFQLLKLIRASTIFFFASLFIAFIYYANVWRGVAHAVLILMTLLGGWGNLLIFVHGINAATLQYIWMASALGFYMKGPKWGWFYSTINILPVFIDVAFTDRTYFRLDVDPEVVVRPVYIYVLTFDFFIITFLHYFFFKTYSKNFLTLTQTKNDLNQTNRKLNEIIYDVKKLSNARMDFLSTMSHELRTPLNGVIGLTEVLLKQNPRKDQEETLSILRFSAENLLALVNDILDFNKLESSKVELENTLFNLDNLIRNIHASMLIKSEVKGLELNLFIDEDIEKRSMYGDPTRLTQVLVNLIDNAIKFTEKGFVNISCAIAERDNQRIRIDFVIEDSGIGIEENNQEKVFDSFIQASPSINRNYGGTGLGLSIVKRVLALHQSGISLKSLPGKGTRISFDIWFELARQNFEGNLIGREEKPISDIDFSDLKVLVAEDNLVNVYVLQQTLLQKDIRPDVAENGKKVVELLLEKDYDVILMDLHMPEMDGEEATKIIRSLNDGRKANIPIIALTAVVNDLIIENVIRNGMTDYVAKPFRPDDLFGKLQKVVTNR